MKDDMDYESVGWSGGAARARFLDKNQSDEAVCFPQHLHASPAPLILQRLLLLLPPLLLLRPLHHRQGVH